MQSWERITELMQKINEKILAYSRFTYVGICSWKVLSSSLRMLNFNVHCIYTEFLWILQLFKSYI